MFDGKPPDVEGECNAHLYLGDDYGDNECTIRCSLPKGHDGVHQEKGRQERNPFTITWRDDEKLPPLPGEPVDEIEVAEGDPPIV